METIILIVHVLLAAGIIALVLLQQGKGAEAGASFGGGASQTVFGSQGSSSVLGRMTAVLAAGVFATSFVLAIFAKDRAESVGDVGIPAAEVIEAAAQQVPVQELPAAGSSSVGTSDIPTVGDK
ncbi:MAG TPA: preprotein translocase subunit SecG [Marinobacterium sp.]|nr:preprotein translocase subunit SecG [Marinobacterium sp.]